VSCFHHVSKCPARTELLLSGSNVMFVIRSAGMCSVSRPASWEWTRRDCNVAAGGCAAASHLPRSGCPGTTHQHHLDHW
jgi:hypothetical protein